MITAPPSQPATTSAADVLALVGAGPGIGAAVAQRFGRQDFRVGLVARSQTRLDKLADPLKAEGIEASAGPALRHRHLSAPLQTWQDGEAWPAAPKVTLRGDGAPVTRQAARDFPGWGTASGSSSIAAAPVTRLPRSGNSRRGA